MDAITISSICTSSTARCFRRRSAPIRSCRSMRSPRSSQRGSPRRLRLEPTLFSVIRLNDRRSLSMFARRFARFWRSKIMLNTFQQRANRVGDTVFAASRQMWLAGLGAAVVTRDWAEKEASGVFRTLVKEGTAVESRAIRIVGDQVESSVTKANVVLKQTRAAIGNVVRAYTD